MSEINTFSIVIPVYNVLNSNVGVFFERLVNSIHQNLNNEYVEKRLAEIILVNDKPTDDITNFLNSIFLKYNILKVKLFSNEINKGQAYSRNYGVTHATGKYIHFIDQDDYIENDFYFNILNKIEEQEPDIVIANVNLVINGESCRICPIRKVTKNIYKRSRFLSDISFLLFSNIAFSPGQFLIKRIVFDKINGFPDLVNKGTDDYGLLFKLAFESKITMIFSEYSIFNYRLHELQGRKHLDMALSLRELFCLLENNLIVDWKFKVFRFLKLNKIGLFVSAFFCVIYFRRVNRN